MPGNWLFLASAVQQIAAIRQHKIELDGSSLSKPTFCFRTQGRYPLPVESGGRLGVSPSSSKRRSGDGRITCSPPTRRVCPIPLSELAIARDIGGQRHPRG